MVDFGGDLAGTIFLARLSIHVKMTGATLIARVVVGGYRLLASYLWRVAQICSPNSDGMNDCSRCMLSLPVDDFHCANRELLFLARVKDCVSHVLR